MPWTIFLSRWTMNAFVWPCKEQDRLRREVPECRWRNVSCASSTREPDSRFPVRVGSRIQVVSTDDIEWIAAAGDYAELHCAGRCHLLRETMAALEQKHDPAQFLRIHRSRIVRARCVRELRPIENREYLLKLSDGSEHRSSRTYAERLDEWLSSSCTATHVYRNKALKP